VSSVSADPRMSTGSRATAGATGTVTVTVAATSANLGPGFDCLGLALDLRDRVTVVASAPRDGRPATTECTVTGHGAGTVPTDADHLVAATLRAGLAELLPGATQPDLLLDCSNDIPHGRGLGSSAAAMVAGLAAAWELAALRADLQPEERVPWLVDRASALEGHGDNAGAAVLGGAIVAWTEAERYRALPLTVDPTLELVVAVPQAVLPTHLARAMLSPTVSRGDAVFTGAHTVVLAHALAGRRDLLLAGTADRLHQDARTEAMPETLSLVRSLRAVGIAAVVSGAGPAVLTFGAPAAAVADRAGSHWWIHRSELGRGVEIVDTALNG